MQAQYSNGGGTGGFVKADSVLVTTARELLAAHGEAEPGTFARCRRCGAAIPCPPARGATEVVAAAGLPTSAGDASKDAADRPRTGTGTRPAGQHADPDPSGPVASAHGPVAATLTRAGSAEVAAPRYLPDPRDPLGAATTRQQPAIVPVPAGSAR